MVRQRQARRLPMLNLTIGLDSAIYPRNFSARFVGKAQDFPGMKGGCLWARTN
jgi:hypothetical protein